VHARDKQMAPRVTFERVARATAGYTGADIMNLMNQAAILTVRAVSRISCIATCHAARRCSIAEANISENPAACCNSAPGPGGDRRTFLTGWKTSSVRCVCYMVLQVAC